MKWNEEEAASSGRVLTSDAISQDEVSPRRNIAPSTFLYCIGQSETRGQDLLDLRRHGQLILTKIYSNPLPQTLLEWPIDLRGFAAAE